MAGTAADEERAVAAPSGASLPAAQQEREALQAAYFAMLRQPKVVARLQKLLLSPSAKVALEAWEIALKTLFAEPKAAGGAAPTKITLINRTAGGASQAIDVTPGGR